MENRITLRMTSALNDLLEAEKQKTGKSKNRIIVEACIALVKSYGEEADETKDRTR